MSKKTWVQGVESRVGIAAKSCAVYEGQVGNAYKDAVNQAVGGLDVKMEKEKGAGNTIHSIVWEDYEAMEGQTPAQLVIGDNEKV